MSEPVKMWRCTACGKWSHALRKPRHHQGFISDDDQLAAGAIPYCDIIRTEEPIYADEYDAGRAGGIWVKCGPFEAWTASRDE